MQYCIDTTFFGQVCDACDGGSVFKILALVVKILTAGIGVLAVLGITVAGIMYLTSSGNEVKMAKAKNRIFQTVIGVLVYGVMFAVLQFLIPGGILQSDLTTNTSSCPVIEHDETTAQNEVTQSQSPETTSDNQTTPDQAQATLDPVNQLSGVPDKMTTVSIGGKSAYIIDTGTSLSSFQNRMKSKKISQFDDQLCKLNGTCTTETKRQGSRCDICSQNLAYDFYFGTTTADSCCRDGGYGRPGFSKISGSPSDFLGQVYDELVAGRPVKIRVRKHTSSANLNHWAVAIGFKSTVTSRDSLTEKDLIIMDTDAAVWYNNGNNSTTIQRANGSETKSDRYMVPLNESGSYNGYKLTATSVSGGQEHDCSF